MKLNIPTSTLKASIHCAATKDIRYYLNGVYIDTTNNNLLRVVSTTGHILSLFSHLLNEHPGETETIIPIEIVKQAVSLHKKSASVELVIDNDQFKLGGIEFKPVDGKFPGYERVIPGRESLDKNSNGTIYNPAYLLTAKKALADFYGHNVNRVSAYEMDHSTQGGAGVMHDGQPDALVCIMPVRTDKKPFVGYMK